MAENTDEEHLDNPINTQSENPSDEIIPTLDTETINPNPETEYMEVHHHPDLHHKPKKWKEYFLEFLMIFLAVTLGFFAESLRESISDRTKEKEFMRSMVQDLKADTAIDNDRAQGFTDIYQNIDTMLSCLKSGTPDAAKINQILSKRFFSYSAYSYNNRTIQQLKNAGNFRLIQNNAVADSILQYDNWMNTVLGQYVDLKNSMISYKEVETRVVQYKELNQSGDSYTRFFDSSDFVHTEKPSFISYDKALLSLYYNRLFYHEVLGHTFISNLKSANKKATSLMQFIQNKYHLE